MGQTLKTKWKSGGEWRELETTRNAGETDVAFLERHWLRVLIEQQDYPVDDWSAADAVVTWCPDA